MQIELTKNGIDSSSLGTIKHPLKKPVFSLFLQKINVKVLRHRSVICFKEQQII